jgi:predicted AlkP superfamily pyrophosphatase or phosphodiesterase
MPSGVRLSQTEIAERRGRPARRDALKITTLSRVAALAGLAVGLGGVTAPARAAAPAAAATVGGKVAPAAPKLVVLLVADQFRADNLTRLGPILDAGGLRRLLQRGATAIGHYGQQNTYTGPGHALIATGSYGYLNGITQNKFWNQRSGRSESMLYDDSVKILGNKKQSADDDNSPRNFIGSTVFDELRLLRPESKVVAVALKGRGAILLGGHLGQAYFFSDQGEMTSSTFYMNQLPAWVQKWNSEKLVDKAFGTRWERLLPAEQYRTPDDAPHESSLMGLGRTFPHPTTGGLSAPGPAYYETVAYTPIGLDAEMSFVRAALAGEKLGQGAATDVLAISISSTDLVGHLYGPFSQEYQDMALRLDRAVATLLAELEKRFKPGELLVAFTADHGATPIPDEVLEAHMLAGRIKKDMIKSTVQKALVAQFGPGDWVMALEDPSIYLSAKLIAQAKVDPLLVEEAAGKALLELPGVLGFFTRTQLLRGWLPPTDAATAVSRSYFPPRAGDLVVVPAPFYFWGKYGENEQGSSHGSFYRYDTDVPVVLYGPWFQPGEYGVIEMVDFAATLAHVLKLTPPAACAGRPVAPMLRPIQR